jgi:hypothetical protein
MGLFYQPIMSGKFSGEQQAKQLGVDTNGGVGSGCGQSSGSGVGNGKGKGGGTGKGNGYGLANPDMEPS